MFAPDAIVTREEMAVILVRAYEHAKGVNANAVQAKSFADEGLVSGWALDAVSKTQALGLINERGRNKFAPKA